MASSPGFGLCIRHGIALFRLAFTTASSPRGLNQATYGTLVGSFFNRNGVTDLRPLHLLVSVRFQILFHRPPGLLFNVPSLYWFTIGQEEYLALAHRRACFRRGFSGLAVLWIWTKGWGSVSPTGLSPSLVPLSSGIRLQSRTFLSAGGRTCPSLQPTNDDSLRSPRYPRFYLRKTRCNG